MTDEVAMPERELILRTQAGETTAFGELVGRYKQRAYYAALGLVGSPDDALDLSQEAFVRAYRARERLDPDLPFYAWLYRILRRLCFNHVRNTRLRRQKLRDATVWIREEATHRAAEQNPQRVVERAELRERVRQGIEELPDRAREVLVLREFEGLRYREIAELLGIPLGTVMSRLYDARRRLAALVEETR